jgi:hypothetical protein
MRVDLIEPTVAGLTCPEGRHDVEYLDLVLRGFGLRVLPSGRKCWFARPASRHRRRISIGPYPAIGAEEARVHAATLLRR